MWRHESTTTDSTHYQPTIDTRLRFDTPAITRYTPPGMTAHDMNGKICLVTGANSGLGRAIATGLARYGATVVMACRNQKRGEAARRYITKISGSTDVHLLIADLSRRQDIVALSETFKRQFDRLDVLVNNAGVLTRTRHLTEEGFEAQFFVNHLAYFLLTNLLVDTLAASAPSRIINVASTAHSRGVLDFDDLQAEKRYDGWQQYANTKLANVMFTYELARRLEGTGVTANCLHPGVIHTNLLRNYSRLLDWLFHRLRGFFRQPEEGAETALYLAVSPDVAGVTGKYFRDSRTCGTSHQSNDPDIQKRLWDVSEMLVGRRSVHPLAR
jgi:NAD(P)-dependent dehydrogenase (short-subunit alcohol dehydrogenase family)